MPANLTRDSGSKRALRSRLHRASIPVPPTQFRVVRLKLRSLATTPCERRVSGFGVKLDVFAQRSNVAREFADLRCNVEQAVPEDLLEAFACPQTLRGFFARRGAAQALAVDDEFSRGVLRLEHVNEPWGAHPSPELRAQQLIEGGVGNAVHPVSDADLEHASPNWAPPHQPQIVFPVTRSYSGVIGRSEQDETAIDERT